MLLLGKICFFSFLLLWSLYLVFFSLVGQFATYPLDVIRRRMQVANAESGFVPSLRYFHFHFISAIVIVF